MLMTLVDTVMQGFSMTVLLEYIDPAYIEVTGKLLLMNLEA